MAASYEDKERGLCHCERYEEDQFDAVKENLLEKNCVELMNLSDSLLDGSRPICEGVRVCS